MSEPTKRESNRVVFRAPARLRGAYGVFDAQVEDVSWTGVRLRLRRAELRIKPDDGIGVAAANVQHLLGSHFAASLDPGRDGAGVVKRLHLVRLSIPGGAPQSVDMGCLFEDRLTDREAHLLGVNLARGASRSGNVRQVVEWKRHDPWRVNLHERSAPATPAEIYDPDGEVDSFVPRKPLRAVLTQAGGGELAPLVCQVESISPHTILVSARGEMLSGERPRTRRDAAAVAVQFTRRFGDHLDAEIVHGTSRLWRGRTHVCSVEVDPNHARNILLRLGFGRPMQEVELNRMRGVGLADAG